MNGFASAGRHVFLSCGEASGARYGVALMKALRRQDPCIRFSALGGHELAAAGADLIQSDASIRVMGFAEVVAALPALWRSRQRVWRHLAAGGIDIVIPIDFPGFNLQVAARARRLGLPVFYAIPPQLWAWGSWRVGKLRRSVDGLGTILPFEEEFFRGHGLPVTHIGHPLMEDYGVLPLADHCRAREERLLDPHHHLSLGLFPGSRRQELQRLVPGLKIAAQLLQSWCAPREVRLVVSAAPGIDPRLLLPLVEAGAEISGDPLPHLLPDVDLALVCSGTASLEAALAGVPHELIYATSPVNYAIARRLVRIRRIGLANLILNVDMVREHIQQDAAPVPVATALMSWLGAPLQRELFYQRADSLRQGLGEVGVWDRAAEAILKLLQPRRTGE